MPSDSGASLQTTIVANDIGPVGGMERQLVELIDGLLDAGHRVTVLSWSCVIPAHPNLHWIRVPGPSRPFVLAYPCFLLVASLLLRLRGRGVIHSTGAIVLNRADIRTVHYCHHAAAGVEGFSRVSRGGLAYRLNARFAAILSRLGERWCYRPAKAGRLVGVSAGVARELNAHFPTMRNRTVVIPNGVDTDTFRPAGPPERNRDGDSGLRALFVGGEWERKGLKPAIEALHGSAGSSLTVVGDGDAGRYAEIAESVGVGDRVEFVGATEDVASYYRKADVFVLPTAYETFSLVSYEAAASGLALLVTRVNGVEDLLRDGVNGWFIDRDPVGIRGRLQQLGSDRRLLVDMGQAARAESLEHSWARVVERYVELYREVSRD